jgi:hypothetical protein
MSRVTLSIALTTMLLAGPAAGAAEYVLLIHEAPAEFAKRTRTDEVGRAYWQAYADFGRALTEAHVLRGGSPLGAPAEGRAVHIERGAVRPARIAAGDGVVLGGYFVVDVPDLETAVQWAGRAPAALTGRVEVRPVPASPAMR